MSGEFETGALASVGGLSSNEGGRASKGEPCRNCGTVIDGRYCSECGQLAQNFHRPIWGLASEMLGDFFSLDGRVMRTLPALMWKPGRVTREYLDGKRQRFVPPFRLYLLTSFIFFLMLFAFGDAHHWFDARYAGPGGVLPDHVQFTGDDGEQVRLNFNEDGQVDVNNPIAIVPSDTESAPPAEENSSPWIRDDGRVNRDVIEGFTCDPGKEGECSFVKGMLHRVADAYENQGMFFASVQSWAPRLALAFTPALIILLALVYPFSRRVFAYDHIITALHLQSWLYLLLCIGLVFFWLGQNWFSILLILLPAMYCYRTFRVVYSSSRFFSFFRTIFVLGALNFVLALLAIALAVLGIADTAPVVGAS